MQSPLKITIHGVDRSEALETRIRAKMEKLEEFFNHITSCHVVVEMPHKHHQQGSQFNVRMDIAVPGNEIVVTRDHAEDVYVALRDAFDAAKRQLTDYAQRLRRDVKNHAPKRPRASAESGTEPDTEVGTAAAAQEVDGNLSKQQIDMLQGIMQKELARLVDETQDEMDPDLKANYIDVGGDGDAGDEAVADTLVDTDNAMIGLHLQKVSDLNAALDRIQAGVYGVCIDCGSDIGLERLSAYPTAKRCIRCQRLHEKTFASEPKSSL
jgi:ribosomal subunit interface protein